MWRLQTKICGAQEKEYSFVWDAESGSACASESQGMGRNWVPVCVEEVTRGDATSTWLNEKDGSMALWSWPSNRMTTLKCNALKKDLEKLGNERPRWEEPKGAMNWRWVAQYYGKMLVYYDFKHQ